MLERMMWFAQAISQPDNIQVRLFPEFVEVADELALGWEQAFEELPIARTTLTEKQLEAIMKLDSYMASVSGPANAHVWEIAALFGAPEWSALRRLAIDLLEEMHWKLEQPSQNIDFYVRL